MIVGNQIVGAFANYNKNSYSHVISISLSSMEMSRTSHRNLDGAIAAAAAITHNLLCRIIGTKMCFRWLVGWLIGRKFYPLELYYYYYSHFTNGEVY